VQDVRSVYAELAPPSATHAAANRVTLGLQLNAHAPLNVKSQLSAHYMQSCPSRRRGPSVTASQASMSTEWGVCAANTRETGLLQRQRQEDNGMAIWYRLTVGCWLPRGAVGSPAVGWGSKTPCSDAASRLTAIARADSRTIGMCIRSEQGRCKNGNWLMWAHLRPCQRSDWARVCCPTPSTQRRQGSLAGLKARLLRAWTGPRSLQPHPAGLSGCPRQSVTWAVLQPGQLRSHLSRTRDLGVWL